MGDRFRSVAGFVKLMKVLSHPAAKDGCRHYRVDLPIEALKKEGKQAEVRDWYNYQAQMSDGKDSTIVGLNRLPSVDVVSFQRPMRRLMFELMVQLQKNGIAVVVEIDDDFSNLAASHPSWADTHPDLDSDRNRNWLKRCTDQADWVTCTTPALAQIYGSHKRVSIIPNYVPAWYLDLPNKWYRDVRVGWAGVTHTHVGDLRVPKNGVSRAIDETGALFCVIGDGKRVQEQLQLTDAPYTSGLVSLDKYPATVSQLDIGIAPLKQTRFNQSKSFLKGLEYSSLGVPWVASPTDSYRDINAQGLGTLASTPDEWHDSLVKLINDEDYRNETALIERQIVRDKFLIENHTDEWWNAYESAANVRQGAKLLV